MSMAVQTEPRVGEPAPDFALESTDGSRVQLAALRGGPNVLLAFFPLAFTGVCTTEMSSFSDDLDAFEREGTRVLGISVDAVPSLRAFRERHGFRTELLSDFFREASRRYGVLLEDLGFSKRAYFLIDREGVLRWKHVERELGHRRENRELLEAIQALG